MNIIDLNNIINTDFDITELVAIDKYVENNKTFQVYDTQRTTSVFVHLKDCRIKYVSSDGYELNAEKGSIVYIPYTAKYSVTYIAESGESAYAQLAAFKLYNDNIGKFIISDKIIKLCDIQNNIYADRFNQLVSISSASVFSHCKFKSVLLSVISDLANSCHNKHNPIANYTLEPCINHLKDNICKNITITELAKICNISESCFRKLFKTHFGVSPNQYIINQRIQKAKDLLQNSAYSINEISEISGFSDSSYFSKAFKKECGISPAGYRNGFIL